MRPHSCVESVVGFGRIGVYPNQDQDEHSGSVKDQLVSYLRPLSGVLRPWHLLNL
jgi:hypothetical protein